MSFKMLSFGNEHDNDNLTFGDIFDSMVVLGIDGHWVSGFKGFDTLPISDFDIRELNYSCEDHRIFILEHKINKFHTLVKVESKYFYEDLLQ